MPELFEWPCDFPGCHKSICEQGAICYLCWEIRCNEHGAHEFHGCHARMTKEERQQRRLDTKARYLRTVLAAVAKRQDDLIQDAQRLRLEHTCEIITPDIDQLVDRCKTAGYNVHFTLQWDDGVKWLVRVRQDRGHRIPFEIRQVDIKSEVTTLRLLREGGVPVPQAWLPGYLEDDAEALTVPPFPFDYFFYEFIDGEAWEVPKHLWYPINLPEDRLKQYVESYAMYHIKMSEIDLPLTHIGCLQSSKEGQVSGPIVRRGTLQIPTKPYLLGPFPTQKERYLAHIDTTLEYILRGAVSRDDAVDAYLWHLELRELVEHSETLNQPISQVYLKHDDEKGDQILHDEEGEVVGVLDWQWAYATTKAEAFAASYIFYECINYFAGKNDMTKEEELLIECYERHGRSDLADCVRGGRLYQRLSHIGQYVDVYIKKGFRGPFGANPAPDFDPPKDDEDWRVYMMERYHGHEGLVALMKRHGWTIERAKEEAEKWHQEQEEKERRKEGETEQQSKDKGISEGDAGIEKDLEKVKIEELENRDSVVDDKGCRPKEDADEEEKEKAEGQSGAT